MRQEELSRKFFPAPSSSYFLNTPETERLYRRHCLSLKDESENLAEN